MVSGARISCGCAAPRPYDDKNPVVLARLGHDPSKATVCFYGHYVSDCQTYLLLSQVTMTSTTSCCHAGACVPHCSLLLLP